MAATTITSGNRQDVKNVSVPATGFTALTFSHAVSSVIIQCRTAVDVRFYQYKGEVPPTEYFTIKSGTVLRFDLQTKESVPQVGWLQSGTGTVTVEAIGIG
jgi:hypothetical protein